VRTGTAHQVSRGLCRAECGWIGEQVAHLAVECAVVAFES
jgi:hypothetical protein